MRLGLRPAVGVSCRFRVVANLILGHEDFEAEGEGKQNNKLKADAGASKSALFLSKPLYLIFSGRPDFCN